MSNAIYAIGDIHGAITKLQRLYDKIKKDIKFHGHNEVTIVFLGDYIDRGENSKAVLDYLMNLEDTEHLKHIFLFGNHEEFMVHAWNMPQSEMVRVWLANGGLKCVHDFNHDFDYFDTDHILDERMKPYIDWLTNETVLLHREGKYVFVHAGVDINHPLDEQSQDILLWSRGKHYDEAPYVVVHGHSIVDEPLDTPNEINVDTGGFIEGRKLTAVKLLPGDASFRDFIMVK